VPEKEMTQQIFINNLFLASWPLGWNSWTVAI